MIHDLRLFFLLFCGFLYQFSAAQNHTEKLYISFYNVENLFDTIDDKHVNDNEFLPKAAKKWNTQKYKQKLQNISKVIGAINEGNAPDILGVCEIENRFILEDLTQILRKNNPKNDYEIIHENSKDPRGIDVAILYRKSKFTEIYHLMYEVNDSNLRTRDIMLAALKTKTNDTLFFIANHFPSRVGGSAKSAYKRNVASQNLKRIFEETSQKYHNANIIILGDFNDEPDNESIEKELGACAYTSKENTCEIYNLFYQFSKEDKGSYFYKNNWEMLDQAMVSKALKNGENHWKSSITSAEIISWDWMTTIDSKNRKMPLRTWQGKKYLQGFSDHFPIGFYIAYIQND